MCKKIAIILVILSMTLLGTVSVLASSQKETIVGGAEIKFVGMEYYEWSNDWFQEMAKKFEEKNPKIKVKVETIPWDSAYDRYIVWIQGGVSPDVGIGGPGWIPELNKLNGLEALDSYIPQSLRDNIFPSYMKILVQGKLFYLPIAIGIRSLYYNTQIFAEVGFNGPPKTWDDLFEVSKRIKANNANIYPFAFNIGDQEAIWNIRHFQLSAGAELADEQGNWKVDTPKNNDVLSFISSLSKNDCFQPGSTGATREEVQQLFITGKSAMLTDNQEVLNRIQQTNADLKFDVAAFPEKREPGVEFVMDTIHLFKGSKNKEAAWKLIEHFLSYDIHLDWAEKTGFFGVTKDVSKVWPKGEMQRKFVELAPLARHYPILPQGGWPVAREEYSKAVQAVVLKTTTVEEALKNAQKRIEERVAK